MKKFVVLSTLGLSGLGLLAICGCDSGVPQVGSQTNWMQSCDSSNDCGDLVCLCGTCTLSCDGNNDCASLDVDSCVLGTEDAASAICNGAPPTAGMCLPRCDDAPCPDGASCVAGVCVATPEDAVSLTVDTSTRYQTLVGFGASLGYDEGVIVSHPQKTALFDAMFNESGFEIIRLRNSLEGDGSVNLESTAEIVQAAVDRIGQGPTIYLTSGSPPASLKQNGGRYCANSDPTCTLISDVDGAFDYTGFAEYWRTSLEAYEAAGVHADYVSIQNNANWIPAGDDIAEACRFLDQEGTTTVTTEDGMSVDATFPGYAEAMDAVLAAVETLPESYSFIGPEIGSAHLVEDFTSALDRVDALGVNFYGIDPTDVDAESLESARQLAEDLQKPLFQVEVHVQAKDALILLHEALVTAGASGYLQQGFAGVSDNALEPVLIGLDESSFVKHDTYYVLSHYARFTDPGFIRVDTAGGGARVLSSAWLSEDESSITIVLTNPRPDTTHAKIELLEGDELLDGTRVYRTVLGAPERLFDLGPLPESGTVRLPPYSIATIARFDE